MANGYDNYSYSGSCQHPPLPLHLSLFLVILIMFVGLSWYINYEPILDGIFDQVKIILMVSPLVLLLAVHWLSNGDEKRSLSFYIPLPEKESLHRAGETPWGVGFLLVFLFFMISYHTSFQERWFPLLSRWFSFLLLNDSLLSLLFFITCYQLWSTDNSFSFIYLLASFVN